MKRKQKSDSKKDSAAPKGRKKSTKESERTLPIGFPFLSHTNVGGGIPAASHAKVTGLLIVSLTNSCSGPSIFGGTVKRMEAI